jgi:hypothetical protein
VTNVTLSPEIQAMIEAKIVNGTLTKFASVADFTNNLNKQLS